MLTRDEKAVDFDWGMNTPAPGVPADDFSARWTGKLIPACLGQVSPRRDRRRRPARLPRREVDRGGLDRTRADDRTGEVTLEAGRSYDLKFEYFEGRIGAVAKLVWQPPALQATGSPYAEALDVAKQADAVVLVLGISAQLEGEEMNVTEPGFAGGDRTNINLPARQQGLLEAVAATGKPVVLVLMSGSALAVNWADAHVPAIVQAWYPGEEGGTALADVLFGDYNPAGRLPVTFYKSVEQLPPFESYAMEGRTYRFFKGQPLYPFGHGLSYTRFRYSQAERLSPSACRRRQALTVSATVENAGARRGRRGRTALRDGLGGFGARARAFARGRRARAPQAGRKALGELHARPTPTRRHQGRRPRGRRAGRVQGERRRQAARLQGHGRRGDDLSTWRGASRSRERRRS